MSEQKNLPEFRDSILTGASNATLTKASNGMAGVVSPRGFHFEPGVPITPEESQKFVANRVHDEAAIYSGTIHPDFASNTVQGAPSIVEMARALKNDPQLIFEFVYNNIDWEPGWGVQKGAVGCLLDGMGNAFDQSLLLAALLRTAALTNTSITNPNIVLGKIQLSEAQYDAWFNTTSISAAFAYCGNLHIPAQTPVGTTMVMSHVWVQVTIAGTTYALDPSYKKAYTRKVGVNNLSTILGYNAATFLSDAESGYIPDPSGNFVQNINRTKIRANLQTMTANLTAYLKANAVGTAPAGTATIDDLLGGQQIVPIVLPFAYQTSLPYDTGATPTIWTGDVPLAYKATLRVQYVGIDQTFTSDQLAGGRLTIWFSGLTPSLYLNGVFVQAGTAQTAGSYNTVYVTPSHNAYSSTQPFSSRIYANNGYYLIASAWGNLGRGEQNYHQGQLAANQAAGGAATSEPVMGEQLAVMFWMWAAQNSRQTDLVNRIMNCKTMYNHQCGVLSFSPGGSNALSTDLGGVSASTMGLANVFPPNAQKTNDIVVPMHGVALEAATVAQMSGNPPGVSTTSVIDKANRTASITFGGTPAAGNTVTLTVTDAALPGGVQAVSYTLPSGATLASVNTNFAAAINANANLAGIGVTATVAPIPSGSVVLV
jgi:transglutaminase-like putative cysteine protease